jgi:hypothetical protein
MIEHSAGAGNRMVGGFRVALGLVWVAPGDVERRALDLHWLVRGPASVE